MLPKLVTLVDTTIDAANVSKIATKHFHSYSNSAISNTGPPLLPIKETAVQNKFHNRDSDDDPNWYIVQSPREILGTAGPFTIPEMREMYKSGEIMEHTLCWSSTHSTEDNWQELQYIYHLKPKLIKLPPIPKRLSMNKEYDEKHIDNQTQLPLKNDIHQAIKMNELNMTRCCYKCGNIAVAHLPNSGEQDAEILRYDSEVGTVSGATEMIPSLVWIGNSSTVKLRAIQTVGFTLVINCTQNMQNLPPMPPYFRCKEAPLPENPTIAFNSNEQLQILEIFDKIYDWIELERVHPELASQSDPAPGIYVGPTDDFGFPLKTAENRKAFRKLPKNHKTFPPRVLLWSRLGRDRPCVVLVAYLIKLCGIKLEKALQIVCSTRANTVISPPYIEVLRVWNEKYVLGTLICIDCRYLALHEDTIMSEMDFIKGSNQPAQSMDDAEEYADETFESQNEPTTGFGRESESSIRTYFNQYDEKRLKGLDLHQCNALESFYKSHPTDQVLPRVMIEEIKMKWVWTGLIDLNLFGLYLKDKPIVILIESLEKSKILFQLRNIDLEGNQIEQRAIKALLVAYYPPDTGFDDDDDVAYGYDMDEQQPVKDTFNLPSELVSLNLAHNRINGEGGRLIGCFLKQNPSVTSLNVSHNQMGDEGVAGILNALERPSMESDYLHEFISEANSWDHQDHHEVIQSSAEAAMDTMKHLYYDAFAHNFSLTSLNVGYNDYGDGSCDALTKVMKNNVILQSIQLEGPNHISPLAYQSLFNGIRLYNCVLEEISFAECTSLSVKTMERLGRMIGNHLTNRIRRLNLSSCQLKAAHIHGLLLGGMGTSRYLNTVDMSNNPSIQDEGVQSLSAILKGWKQLLLDPNETGTIHCPPITHFDVSQCNVSVKGATHLAEGIAQRHLYLTEDAKMDSQKELMMRHLDLSHNHLKYSTIMDQEFKSWIKALCQCNIWELSLNHCLIGSQGTNLLFASLAIQGPRTLRSLQINRLAMSLRILSLSSNEIGDSIVTGLCRLLECNYTLGHLDLSFNQLTNVHVNEYKKAIQVTSESTEEKKLLELSVNIVGNENCDPFMFETPGMARSKNNLKFGIDPNPADMYNHGYSHVPNESRRDFIQRMSLRTEYQKYFPNVLINKIP